MSHSQVAFVPATVTQSFALYCLCPVSSRPSAGHSRLCGSALRTKLPDDSPTRNNGCLYSPSARIALGRATHRVGSYRRAGTLSGEWALCCCGVPNPGPGLGPDVYPGMTRDDDRRIAYAEEKKSRCVSSGDFVIRGVVVFIIIIIILAQELGLFCRVRRRRWWLAWLRTSNLQST